MATPKNPKKSGPFSLPETVTSVQELREQRLQLRARRAAGLAVPREDSRQLAHSPLKIVVDHCVLKFAAVGHVTHRIPQAPLDHRLAVGGAVAQTALELSAGRRQIGRA